MSDLIPNDGAGNRPEEPDGAGAEPSKSPYLQADFIRDNVPESLLQRRLGRIDTRKALADLCRNIPGLEDVLLPKGFQADSLTRKSSGNRLVQGLTRKVRQDQAAWDAFRTAIRGQVPPETSEAMQSLTTENLEEVSGVHTTEGLILASTTAEEPPTEEIFQALVATWEEENHREEKRASKDAKVKEMESEVERLKHENERLSFAQRAAAQQVEVLAEEVRTLNDERDGNANRLKTAEERASAAVEEKERLDGRVVELERRSRQLERALEGERRAYSRAAERVDEMHEELGVVVGERDKIRDALQNARFTDKGFGELLVRAIKNEVVSMPNNLEQAAKTAHLLEFMGKVLQAHDEVRAGRKPGGSDRRHAREESPEDGEPSPASELRPAPPPKEDTPRKQDPDDADTATSQRQDVSGKAEARRRPTLSFRALGGAGEVGGSSHLIDFGKTRILVDAGIKPDGRGSITPSFQRAERLDAAIITHAHLDHCGALPLLVKERPDLPIYCTPPSAKLIVNALNDHAAMGGSIPGGAPIHEVKKRLIPVNFGKELSVGDTKFILKESGHLLGAASVLLRSGSARVFHTGDICLEDHFSIPSANLPDVKDIDLLIMEATLADQKPQPFTDSVKTMIEVINDTTLKRDGTVLIPTYALGQAQEIILALKHFSDELERNVFIYVDGSVVTASERLYAEQIGYMKPYLQQSNPKEVFFSENIRAVTNDDRARERILASPCAIIASPVTMQGGMSGFYRKRLEGSSKNAVLLPSNASSAYAASRQNQENGEENWRVENISFAAHCTQSDLLSITKRLSPRQIILIHGSKRRISDLAFRLAPMHKIHTPSVGETVRTVL